MNIDFKINDDFLNNIKSDDDKIIVIFIISRIYNIPKNKLNKDKINVETTSDKVLIYYDNKQLLELKIRL